MIWFLAIACLLILGYFLLIRPQLYWKRKNVLQGPPIPIVGENLYALLGRETLSEMVTRVYNRGRGKRYVGIYQMTLPALMLRDPELIKQITVKYFDHFTDHRNFAPEGIEPLWEKSLFQLHGDEWREMRATLSPTFTASKMRAMFVLMEKSAQQYIDFYMQKNEERVDVELKDSFTRFANDAIGNCVFGVTVDSLRDPNNEFYVQGKDLTTMTGFYRNAVFLLNVMAPSLNKLLKLPLLPANSTTFFTELLKDTFELREKQHIVRPDMINLLMEASKGRLECDESHGKDDAQMPRAAMTDLDMAAQMMIFFFAGFETISTTLSFCCYELAVNLDVQEKLRQEIDDTNAENMGKLTYDLLGRMTYMDMVVSEVMRKTPPLSAIERVCTKSFTIAAERSGETPLELQVGDVLWLPVNGLQQDAKYFPNPEKFDPERFSEENKRNINAYAYIPFGSGPRGCIGSRFALMEVKTLLFHILSQFELTVIAKTVIPIKLLKFSFTPGIEGGFWVGFQRRKLRT